MELRAKALPLVAYMNTCAYVVKHTIETRVKMLYNFFVWKKETTRKTNNLTCKLQVPLEVV